MASSWKGKTRGGILGYKIFVFILRKLGLAPAYLVLRIVAFYYFLTSFKSSAFVYYFFRKVLKLSVLRSFFKIYTNYFVFGQTLLDKVAIRAGITGKFTFHLEGEEHLVDLAKNKNGGILISAHVGNWDISGHLLHRLNTKVNVVMFDAEHENIKKYLKDVMGKNRFEIIVIKEDYSHIFHISKALINKEFICIHGDRYVEGSKVISADFMGKKTYFPYGPFHLATKFKVPYTFVFGFKETASHYHFYATPPKINTGGVRAVVQEYSEKLEELVRIYPEQWFNYYDYWAEVDKQYIVEE